MSPPDPSASPRAPPAPNARFHLIGIGGICVSGVARGLLALGYRVSGSDARPSSITQALAREGADVHIGHDAAHVYGADVVVVSTAIRPGNPEVAEAERLGIPVEHRSITLDRIVGHFTSLGVSGTNGKGTVASMATAILEAWGRRPSFLIGGLLEAYGTNARIHESEHLVVEIDESDGSLVNVHPDVALICNLELDHLNYYKSFDDVLARVRQFLTANPRLRFAVCPASDPGSRALMAACPDVRFVTTSADPAHPAELEARDLQVDGLGSSFALRDRQAGDLGRVTLAVPGRYNVDNALVAAAGCLALGAPAQAVREGLASYRGLRNRFTATRAGGSWVVKDYISHPTGMRRVLEALRGLVGPDLPVVAVFKPYRYTMIRYLGDEYAQSFHDADQVVITDMWEAHEEPIPGINTAWLVDKVRGAGVSVAHVPGTEDVVPDLLARFRGPFATIFFGGDDLFAQADHLLHALEERA